MKRSLPALTALIIASLSFSSCTGESVTIDIPEDITAAPIETTGPAVSSLSPELTAPDPDASVDPADYTSLEAFASAFLQIAAASSDEGENVAVSPLSAYTALSMLYEGADNLTADELEGILGTVGRDSVYALLSHLSTLEASVVESSNSLWIQNNTPVGTSFISTLARYYLAECFQTEIADAEGVINSFVSDKTDGRIDGLLTDDSLDGATTALVSTFSLSAGWAEGFDESLTKSASFTNADGTTTETEFMTNGGDFEYVINTPDFLGVVLPYSDESLEFVAVMSKDESMSTDELCSAIADEGGFSELCEMKVYQGCTLYVPKFSLNHSTTLSEILNKLGLKTLFTAEADLSGISSSILINNIFHTCVFEVSENGSHAGADASVASDDPQTDSTYPFVVNFNRPFVFAVRDTASGAVLFAGTYVTA